MSKKLINIISILLVCVLLFQFAYETKVKAAEPITLSTVGLAAFALIAAACGYTALKRADMESMYESFMRLKGNSISFIDKAKILLGTGIVAGKIVMDKANDAVSSVIDFFKGLSIKKEAGVQTVDVNPESVKIIDEPIVDGGLLLTVNVGYNDNERRTIPLIIFGDNNQYVLELFTGGQYKGLGVNGKRITLIGEGDLLAPFGFVEEANNVRINYLSYRIENIPDYLGRPRDFLTLTLSWSANVYTNGINKELTEWRDSNGGIVTCSVQITDELLNYNNPDVQMPISADLYVSPDAVHLGHDISADINSPTIPLLGIDEGIDKKGDALVWEGGNVDDFIDYLTNNTDVWDRVVDYVVGKTKDAIDALPVVVPNVDADVGAISWPATDAIDPSIPDVQNPDIPIVWKDLFKTGTKTLDFSPFMEIGLSERFPFCVPYDLVNSIKTLKAPPKAPKWVANIKGVDLVIDFSQFEHLASIVRWFMTFLFIVILIMISRRMIGGE